MVLISGIAVGVGGGALVWANANQRDSAGYFSTPTEQFHSAGRALVSSVDFSMQPGPSSWISLNPLGTVRVRVSIAGASTFVGVARTAAVDRYLAGVAYDEVKSVSILPLRANYRWTSGSATPAPPTGQDFWAASASGTGTQQLKWHSERGRWSLVVMRSDAGSGVVARVSVATNTGLVLPVGIMLLVGAFIMVLLGGSMLGIGMIGLERRRRGEVPPTAQREYAPPVSGAYPARLDGRLDPFVSRWRWLFKWLLVLPHVFVLAFLWLAVFSLSVVAGFMILFTGRYPRSIFDFTVGVMRWTWRVSFYSFSALGTDYYPPFSLESDDTYPASFEVDYPEHLSRGLVLVKWWLLAIPHYIIVGLFAGGGVGFASGLHNDWRFAAGGGAIGLVVCVAGVLLLITGRYPPALFEFVMGMNRWCYRVFAYVLLLRDEYPPFRFDAGGVDPGSASPPAPATRGPGSTGSDITGVANQ
ncbi:MAG TPA: DUF4389 domain-containing protein [Acidimicrobiales bacterium]|nr:DUF4389 domain-containing protein [Acidimicrobiales bacterium]